MKLLYYILTLFFLFSVKILFSQELVAYKNFKHPHKGQYIFSGKYFEAKIDSKINLEIKKFFAGNRMYRIIIDREINDDKLILVLLDSKNRIFYKKTITKKVTYFDFEIDGDEKLKLKLLHPDKTKVPEKINLFIGFKAYNKRTIF